ncbi:MAG: FAD-dependent oxidoreductase [Oscillospiraceae bacterium]|nr:FAD-dependent oxidoreductase [Oscillospiraceae bacterium]
METRYDVVIIGGGIGGLMAAYGLRVQHPALSVAIAEKGRMVEQRKCPAAGGKSCVYCPVCSITSGFAGAGAFSDGKFNLGTAYGGTLGEELGENLAMEYIHRVSEVLDRFTPEGIHVREYGSNEELKLKCLQNNLRLLDMNVKHLGTDNNLLIMQNLIRWLEENGVDLLPGTEVHRVRALPAGYGLDTAKGPLEAGKLIVATGRNGAEFVGELCRQFGIARKSNAVDIGVRVEMKDAIWREFSSQIYEPKILCRTKTFEDRTRMFCFNQGGIVSAENNDGIVTANGHSFADPAKKTDNCNFAILSSIHFTEPFNNPTEYAKSFSKMANLIGNGNVLVQRFGDLIRGRRTNDHRLGQNTVIPTLKATAGDISLALPHRILTNIIETVYALDKVAPGTANDDTLLYGLESKYYSIKPDHDRDFRIHDGIWLIGDGSGICRGLSQSGAMGLYVADRIAHR